MNKFLYIAAGTVVGFLIGGPLGLFVAGTFGGTIGTLGGAVMGGYSGNKLAK